MIVTPKPDLDIHRWMTHTTVLYSSDGQPLWFAPITVEHQTHLPNILTTTNMIMMMLFLFTMIKLHMLPKLLMVRLTYGNYLIDFILLLFRTCCGWWNLNLKLGPALVLPRSYSHWPRSLFQTRGQRAGIQGGSGHQSKAACLARRP